MKFCCSVIIIDRLAIKMGYVWYFVKLSIYHFNSNALYESAFNTNTPPCNRSIPPPPYSLPYPNLSSPGLTGQCKDRQGHEDLRPNGSRHDRRLCSRNPALLLSKIKDANVKDAMSRGLPSSGFRAPGPVVFDSKRAVVLTDVRHFGSQAYNEPLDIRRADFTGAACGTPFFLFPSPLFLSLSLHPLSTCDVSFFLLLSLALSRTPVDLLGGGSDRCSRQVFGQCATPDFNSRNIQRNKSPLHKTDCISLSNEIYF